MGCLLAADELAVAGADTTRLRIGQGADALAAAIRAALDLLGALPADVLAQDPILDAGADASDALALRG